MVAKIKTIVDGGPDSLYALALVTLEHEVEDAKRVKRLQQQDKRVKQ